MPKQHDEDPAPAETSPTPRPFRSAKDHQADLIARRQAEANDPALAETAAAKARERRRQAIENARRRAAEQDAADAEQWDDSEPTTCILHDAVADRVGARIEAAAAEAALEDDPLAELPRLNEYDHRLLRDFRYAVDRDHNHRVYYITDHAKMTVEICNTSNTGLGDAVSKNGAWEQLEDLYREVATDALQAGLGVAGSALVEDDGTWYYHKILTLEKYLTFCRPLLVRDREHYFVEEPVIISNTAGTPAFNHIDPTKLPAVDESRCRDWTDWEQAMPECCRPAWRAWVYSLIDAENRGRQAMWLHGEGYDGKSMVAKAISHMIGDNGVQAIGRDSLSNQFAFSFLYGRRLAIWGDCKNDKALHSEKIHSILGGDVVSIERKGEQAFTAKVHCKLLICSNIEPDVNLSERNESTRILYIPLGEPPAEVMRKYCLYDDETGAILRDKEGQPRVKGYNLDERLIEQTPHYLALCRDSYNALCTSRDDIDIPDDMREILYNTCESDDDRNAADFVQRFLEPAAGGNVGCTELGRIYGQYLESLGQHCNRYNVTHLNRYLATLGFKKHRPRIDGVSTRCFKGLRLRANTLAPHR